MSQLGALLSGLLFALGLALSGMTAPGRVLAFLDIGGDWDPTLALVMGSALAVYAVLVRVIARRPRPLAAPAFDRPAASAIDLRLLSGAAIFGVGWGLSGFCPAPAVMAAGAGAPEALVFGAAMLAGMEAFRMLAARHALSRADDDSGRNAWVSDA